MREVVAVDFMSIVFCEVGVTDYGDMENKDIGDRWCFAHSIRLAVSRFDGLWATGSGTTSRRTTSRSTCGSMRKNLSLPSCGTLVQTPSKVCCLCCHRPHSISVRSSVCLHASAVSTGDASERVWFWSPALSLGSSQGLHQSERLPARQAGSRPQS